MCIRDRYGGRRTSKVNGCIHGLSQIPYRNRQRELISWSEDNSLGDEQPETNVPGPPVCELGIGANNPPQKRLTVMKPKDIGKARPDQ